MYFKQSEEGSVRGTGRDKFDDVPRIRELAHIFKSKFEHLHVDSVWLLKKMSSNDGFQGWHRDFALEQKITTTIVVTSLTAIGAHECQLFDKLLW